MSKTGKLTVIPVAQLNVFGYMPLELSNVPSSFAPVPLPKMAVCQLNRGK